MRLILILLTIFNFPFSYSKKELPTMAKVDLQKYTGQWYEISRLPNSFEKNLVCVTANYSIKENGKIEVINKGLIALWRQTLIAKHVLKGGVESWKKTEN